MKNLIIILISVICLSFIDWHKNLEEAEQIAKKEHKHILLNFSGSDWCGPCIRLHKEILENEIFKQFATSKLVLINTDFPRLKKNQLSPEQQMINDRIADKYNSKGIFPLTLLLNENGKLLKSWEGFPKISPEQFVADIQFEITQNK